MSQSECFQMSKKLLEMSRLSTFLDQHLWYENILTVN